MIIVLTSCQDVRSPQLNQFYACANEEPISVELPRLRSSSDVAVKSGLCPYTYVLERPNEIKIILDGSIDVSGGFVMVIDGFTSFCIVFRHGPNDKPNSNVYTRMLNSLLSGLQKHL